MDYKLLVSDEKKWHKDCSKIHMEGLRRIKKRTQLLRKLPWDRNIDVKQLHEFGVADYRLRIGDYRVLFNKYDDKKEIHLLRVLHRSKLY